MDDTDYALGRTNSEYHRLIEQAALLRPLTERTFRAAGIGAGMHVLDIGCGVGDVSFLVNEVVGPDGSVVGVDVDADAIQFAEQRRVEHAIANVVFSQSDARAIQSERPFDAAVGRFVLMFMSDPTDVLRRIAAKLREGGIAAFHEWMAGTSPTSPGKYPVLTSFLTLLSTTFERSGASLDIGAELHWRMQDAGLEPCPQPLAEIAVCLGHGPIAYRRWAQMGQSMAPKIVQYGVASEGEISNIIEHDLRDELARARDLVPLSWPMIGQWAHKPSSAVR